MRAKVLEVRTKVLVSRAVRLMRSRGTKKPALFQRRASPFLGRIQKVALPHLATWPLRTSVRPRWADRHPLLPALRHPVGHEPRVRQLSTLPGGRREGTPYPALA